jgi:PKD repeat protein
MVRRGVVLLAVLMVAAGCGGEKEEPEGAPEKVQQPATGTPVAKPPPVEPTEEDAGYEELDVWIEAEPDEGPPPLRVQFTSEVESDVENGGPYRYEWDFGDAGSSKEANPVYTYQKLGEYTVTLVVRDDKGNNGSDEIDVWVEEEQ